MTAVTSKLTQEQTEAFGVFITVWKAFWSGVVGKLGELAAAYKACTALGMDMSADALAPHNIPRRVVLIVRHVADGGLSPELAAKVLTSTESVIEHVAHASPSAKEEILKEGLPVLREGKIQRVPIEEANTRDVRMAIDKTGGRFRTAEQQMKYSEPRASRNDWEMALTFTPEDKEWLFKTAQRRNQSPRAFVFSLLIDEGMRDGQKSATKKRKARRSESSHAEA